MSGIHACKFKTTDLNKIVKLNLFRTIVHPGSEHGVTTKTPFFFYGIDFVGDGEGLVIYRK